MIVGACTIRLMIYEANSLKDKRHVVKSIIGKIKSRYNVSIAEIDLNEKWRSSVIGFACVSNDTVHVQQIIDSVIKFIDRNSEVEIIDYDVEML